MINEVEIGKEYNVNDSRKGKFTMRVTEIRVPWISGEITGGAAHFITEDTRHAGSGITVRDSLATFTPTT